MESKLLIPILDNTLASSLDLYSLFIILSLLNVCSNVNFLVVSSSNIEANDGFDFKLNENVANSLIVIVDLESCVVL